MSIEKKGGWTSNQIVNTIILFALTVSVAALAFRNPLSPSPTGEVSITGEFDISTVSKIPRIEHCFEHTAGSFAGSMSLAEAEEIIRDHTGEYKGISVSAEMLVGMADMKSIMGSSVAGFHIYYTKRDSRKGVVLIPVDNRSDEILIEEEGTTPYWYMEISEEFDAPCPDLCDHYELPR